MDASQNSIIVKELKKFRKIFALKAELESLKALEEYSLNIDIFESDVRDVILRLRGLSK